MKFLSALLALVVVTGCAKNPATGKSDFIIISEEEEFNLGEEGVRQSIKKEGLFKKNKDLTKYYKNLGYKLVEITERSDKPFDFIMLDSGTFNAWATPGYINVYRGILPYLNSESELVALLGHEAGHITARHAARTVSAARAAQGLMALGAVLVAVKTEDPDAGKVAVGAAGVAAQFGFSKYSRSNEDEADMLALRYMETLGYDPREAAGLYRTMALKHILDKKIYAYFNNGEEPEVPPFYDLLLSHPDPNDRLLGVENRVGILPKNHVAKSQNVYYKQIDGLAFGPSFRKYGAAGERNVYFPKERVQLTMPEGFLTVYEKGRGWRSYDDTTRTKAFISKTHVDKDEDPEETLRVEFPKIRKLRPLNINGLEAYTGVRKWVEKGAWGSEKHLGEERIFGIKGGVATSDEGVVKTSNKNFYIVRYFVEEGQLATIDEKLFESAQSFKVLSAKKADALQPLRIKIHTVKKGETVASLSEKMAFGDLKEQWFRTLNSMLDYDKLKVGQKVKLVIDPNV